MNKLTMALLMEYHLNTSFDTILADVYWLIWMRIHGILLLLFLKDKKKSMKLKTSPHNIKE